tara:strand:+ start:22541 stop:22693 length:153 start_codon:yes stop_codon:yes gene_type:complete
LTEHSSIDKLVHATNGEWAAIAKMFPAPKIGSLTEFGQAVSWPLGLVANA